MVEEFQGLGRQLRNALWCVLFAAVLYVTAALYAGRTEFFAALEKVGVAGVGFALMMSSANYLLRFVRWRLYMHALQLRVPVGPSAWIYAAGFALSATPGKAGEMVRGVFLLRYAVPFARNAALFVAERLSDLTAVLLLALPGVARIQGGSRVATIGAALMAIAYFGLCIVPWRIAGRKCEKAESRLGRFWGHICQIAIDARCCLQVGPLAGGLLLAALAWTAEAWALHCVLSWQGHEMALSSVFMIYALSRLVGVLSFMPGGIGSTEFVMVAMLVQAGVPMGDAVATTLVNRFTTLWYVVSLGMFALFRLLRAGERNRLAHTSGGVER
nr:lysylphosphatidylglycerol synthase transmembrane domain-containing protein [uncultured Cupriavidus sp.]